MTTVPFPRPSRLALAALLALLVIACGGDGQNPLDEGQGPPDAGRADPTIDLLSTLNVSNPMASSIAAGAGLTFSATSPSEDVVFVSLPPGSIPNGETAVVHTRATQAQATAAMADGGFDPIPIVAAVGDTLDIRIALADGGAQLDFYAVVPPSSPPVIVRTDPPPQKHDVPLNVFMRVVFSEPIDASTLTASSVQLLLDGEPVAGTLEIGDGTNLTATFTPAELLVPGTDYSLVITTGIEDLDGDPLAEEFRADFTTESSSATVQAAVAFVSNRDGAAHVYVADPDGSNVRRLAEGWFPAWSWDGRKIAFHRQASEAGPDGIYVMDDDGSDLTFVGPGRWPAWSPAGRIAFDNDDGIAVMNADGSGVKQLLSNSRLCPHSAECGEDYRAISPSWSPDGRSIAFLAQGPAGARVGTLDADGLDPSAFRLLHSPTGFLHSGAVWSPDGSRIAVISIPSAVPWSHPDYPYDFYTYDVASASWHVVHTAPGTGSGGAATTPDWSPDGSHILFSGQSGTHPWAYRRIFTVSLETGAVRQFIPDATDPVVADYSDWYPVWSRN